MHVQVALGMLRPGDVGERQFVHDAKGRVAFENGVNVERFDNVAIVFDLFSRNDFQTVEESLGFLATVSFDPANDHVHAGLFQAMRLFQHRKSFSDACRVAEIDF